MKVTVESIVKAPVAKVWRAYTTTEDIKHWNTQSQPIPLISSALDGKRS